MRAQFGSTVLVTGLLLAGCDRGVPSPETAKDAARTSGVTVAKGPEVADGSLPSERYIALGLPAHDREWMSQDMAAAATALQALANSHPEQLPRFQSPRSGPVFARIVARENLNIFRDRSVPLEARLAMAIQYGDSSTAILKIYLSALLAKRVGDAEIIELYGALLRNSQVALDLTDEFLPTISKDDPKYQVRMAGLERMQRGMAGMVVQILTSLTEVAGYRVDERLKLLGYCRQTLPSIVPRLSGPSQAEVLHRLDALATETKLPELQMDMVLLRNEVHAAAQTRGERQ